MKFYQFDPTKDPRWAELVERHTRASIFHTVGWLKALRHTYGYEASAFTTSSPTGNLENGWVFCRINSWLTGRRLVSLPFSDHCEPLCDALEDVNFLVRYLQTTLDHQEWKYLEMRPIDGRFSQLIGEVGFLPATTYFLHTLDLQPELKEVFRSLDQDCVRRRIQRARKVGLVEKCGRSDELLREFYALFSNTRSRHHLPPTPYVWFKNLIHYLGEALEIRVAYNGKTPVAAILTLRFRDVVYYKYGCSDARFNKFGSMPWLLWNAIQEAEIEDGAREFDMGRTDDRNEGLLTFKNHWVPHPKRLVYWKFPDFSSIDSADGWKLRFAKRRYFLPTCRKDC